MKSEDKLASALRTMMGNETPATIVKGVVKSIDSGTVSVGCEISGDTRVIDGIKYVASYYPAIDDVVVIAKQRHSMIILDRLATTDGSGNTHHGPNAHSDPNTHSHIRLYDFSSEDHVHDLTTSYADYSGNPSITTNLPRGFAKVTYGMRGDSTDNDTLNIALDISGANTKSGNSDNGCVAISGGIVQHTAEKTDLYQNMNTGDTNFHLHAKATTPSSVRMWESWIVIEA